MTEIGRCKQCGMNYEVITDDGDDRVIDYRDVPLDPMFDGICLECLNLESDIEFDNRIETILNETPEEA
jgi:hypothetical protein